MLKVFSCLILVVNLIHAEMPKYRTMGTKTAAGDWLEVYFDRYSETKNELTLWASTNEKTPKKWIIDRKNMKIKIDDGKFEDLIPGSVAEGMANWGEQLNILNRIKPPIFRRVKIEKNIVQSIYNDDFKWISAERAQWVESKTPEKAIVWLLSWRNVEESLFHQLLRIEVTVKSKKLKVTESIGTFYEKSLDRDLIINASEIIDSNPMDIPSGSLLWTLLLEK